MPSECRVSFDGRITPRDCARLLNVTERTLMQWRLERRGPPWRFEEFWPEWLRLTTSVDQSKAKSGFPPTQSSCAGGWGQDELRKIATWRAAHPAA